MGTFVRETKGGCYLAAVTGENTLVSCVTVLGYPAPAHSLLVSSLLCLCPWHSLLFSVSVRLPPRLLVSVSPECKSHEAATPVLLGSQSWALNASSPGGTPEWLS